MADYEKFDVAKLERLNDPARLERVPAERIASAFGDARPATLIDVGAGTGLYACKLAELMPETTVLAVDTEPTMVDWMERHLQRVPAGRVVPMLGTEERLPVPDHVGDGAFMVNVHHELVDPVASYREIRRALKPGARIVISDWLPSDQEMGPPQRIRATAETIAEMLERAGYTDAQILEPAGPNSLVTAVAN